MSVWSDPWNGPRPMNLSVHCGPPPPVSCSVTSTWTSAVLAVADVVDEGHFLADVVLVALVAVEEHAYIWRFGWDAGTAAAGCGLPPPETRATRALKHR